MSLTIPALCVFDDFLYIASFAFRFSVFAITGKSYWLNDDSDNDRSDSASSSTCSFPLRFEDSVGHVSGLWSRFFVPTGVESKCDVFVFVVFMTIVIQSKGG